MLDFMRNLLDPLFNAMGATLTTFHGWGTPWWLAIVMLTVVVRTLLFPLTYRQVKNLRKLQDLKPEMDEIRARYKDDALTQREEIARLYQERKVNPLGGCLPIALQLPIFLVLYYTIRQFDKLDSFRTGGLFWFTDLTVADPLFILPVAYVLTMMASQELAMRNTVAKQKQIMRFMPLMFGFFLARFPAGLFVYWVTSNLITFCQNYLIYRRVPQPPPPEADPTTSPEETTRKGQGENVAPAPKTTEGSMKRGRVKSRKKKGASKRRWWPATIAILDVDALAEDILVQLLRGLLLLAHSRPLQYCCRQDRERRPHSSLDGTRGEAREHRCYARPPRWPPQGRNQRLRGQRTRYGRPGSPWLIQKSGLPDRPNPAEKTLGSMSNS